MNPAAPGVVPAVGRLLAEATRVYAGGPAEPALRAVVSRMREPLRVAIAGRVKAGKSTLLNALVGQELAATDAGECTRLVTWYVDGVAYRVDLHPVAGPPRQLPFRQQHGSLEIDLGGLPVERVERLVVTWPSPMLRRTTLIDTPGIGSVDTEVSARSERILAPDNGEVTAADAVVYLMRHAHGDDVRFLEAFRDGAPDRRTVNTIAVLSRCDEIGHARPDALTTAARIADRYRLDPRVRALCQTVVPVAGLLASSAASLREAEYRALATLASAPDTDRLLLTAGRFETTETDGGVSTAERAALLRRYGLFGVRTAVRLVRDGGVAGASDLARELTAASGMAELRHLLSTQFGARADVLKARSALSALEAVLRRYPIPAARAAGARARARPGERPRVRRDRTDRRPAQPAGPAAGVRAARRRAAAGRRGHGPGDAAGPRPAGGPAGGPTGRGRAAPALAAPRGEPRGHPRARRGGACPRPDLRGNPQHATR